MLIPIDSGRVMLEVTRTQPPQGRKIPDPFKRYAVWLVGPLLPVTWDHLGYVQSFGRQGRTGKLWSFHYSKRGHHEAGLRGVTSRRLALEGLVEYHEREETR